MPGVAEDYRCPFVSRFKLHVQCVCFTPYLFRKHVPPVDGPQVGDIAPDLLVALRPEP